MAATALSSCKRVFHAAKTHHQSAEKFGRLTVLRQTEGTIMLNVFADNTSRLLSALEVFSNWALYKMTYSFIHSFTV